MQFRRQAATSSSDAELIRKLDFFEPLDQKIVRKIAHMCIVREFSTGDFIVRQGESGLGLYFITQGRAKVEIERNGIRAFVAELQSGDFLGELSIIDDKARSANVICMEDTRCLLLTRDTFSKLVNKHPEIAIQMVKTLVGRIRNTNEKISQSGPSPEQAPAAAAPENPAPEPETLVSKLTNLPSMVMDSNLLKTYSSTKNKAKEFMVDLFGAVYVMKEMTRFSMALVGCPVLVEAETRRSEVLLTSLYGVKLALFPAAGDQVLRIHPYADGEFSATVFRPAVPGRSTELAVRHFKGNVRRNESLRLHVPAQEEMWLETAARQHPRNRGRRNDASQIRRSVKGT
jgi:CRP-like cAMP-binding protein